MGFRVVSYNVLADGYIRPEYYAGTPAELLLPAVRHPALATRLVGLTPDVACLQEVEAAVLARIARAFPGYERHEAPKPGRPDAVAILTRFPALDHRRIVYPDATSRVALLLVLDVDGRRLGVACTHLKFDAAGESFGPSQAAALVDAIAGVEPACDGWVVCGDFNATPESEVLERMRARGLRDGHAGSGAPTCNFAGGPKRIDFVLHSASLRATPLPLAAVDARTALPSREEPSDHLPVGADLAFVSA